jgi:uroporphyrinogen decarboxylase
MYDTTQMLALPELDVLEALGCDLVHVTMAEHTNAFVEPERWVPYDHNGRLPALVMNPDAYRVLADGTIVQGSGPSYTMMPPSSYVFDQEHGGELLELDSELREPYYEAESRRKKSSLLTPGRVRAVAEYCRRVRSSTDRAVFFNGLQAGLGFPGGMAAFSMTCMLHPQWVHELHRIQAEHVVAQVNRLLPEIRQSIDLIMFEANDLGTQSAPILPPRLFRDLYVPYYRMMNDAIHAAAPEVKVFLHSCGAVYPLIPDIIDAGFDVLNPVQWTAGGQSYRDWKEAAGGRIALWGGGVNTQRTLPLGTVHDVEREVREVVEVMARDSGYVFAPIHNILAEIDPLKVIAAYRAAGEVGTLPAEQDRGCPVAG